MTVNFRDRGLARSAAKCPGVSCAPSRSCVLMPSRADADLAAAAPSGGRALRQRKPSLDVPPSDRCEAGIPRRRAHGVPEDSSDGANVTAPPPAPCCSGREDDDPDAVEDDYEEEEYEKEKEALQQLVHFQEL